MTKYCCQKPSVEAAHWPEPGVALDRPELVFNEKRFQAAGGTNTLVILRGTGAALETGSVSLCGLKTSQPQFPSTTYFYFISESAGRSGPFACSAPSTHSHCLKPGSRQAPAPAPAPGGGGLKPSTWSAAPAHPIMEILTDKNVKSIQRLLVWNLHFSGTKNHSDLHVVRRDLHDLNDK